jgi:copper chaperone CopZ
VRAALLAVTGVTRARVTLDPDEALVTYDPARVKVEDLIAAVGKATPPQDQVYSAKVKDKDKPKDKPK